MLSTPQPRYFGFYLFDGFSILSFSSALEALRLANEVSGKNLYSWRKISEHGDVVRSDSDIGVEVDGALQEERLVFCSRRQPDVIVLCGGLTPPVISRAARAWLRENRKRGAVLCSIGSATAALAEAGLLDEKRCVVHWHMEPGFTERFHRTQVEKQLFMSDGDLYTAAGGSSVFDMILEMIADDLEPWVVNRICEMALLERVRNRTDRQRTPLQTRVGTSNTNVLRVVELMETNLVEPLTLNQLAAAIGVSRRQVERLFIEELGRSPARYYRDIRLERAHLLLTACSLPVVDIATACGFVSASHFSRCYREVYRCTPVETRAKAGVKRSGNSARTAAADAGARRGNVGAGHGGQKTVVLFA